jgi:hypothetical protein
MQYCIACGQRHIQQSKEEVLVCDKKGLGLVTYHKDCTDKAKELTVQGLISRGYTSEGIAGKIIEGIKDKNVGNGVKR